MSRCLFVFGLACERHEIVACTTPFAWLRHRVLARNARECRGICLEEVTPA
jgi:hypothetical protein